jgi:hypothetical protein
MLIRDNNKKYINTFCGESANLPLSSKIKSSYEQSTRYRPN